MGQTLTSTRRHKVQNVSVDDGHVDLVEEEPLPPLDGPVGEPVIGLQLVSCIVVVIKEV